jgi:hypothetical protein
MPVINAIAAGNCVILKVIAVASLSSFTDYVFRMLAF